MLVLGLAGGLDAVHEQKLDTPENYTYDGAAVLVEDGVVIAAVEQERLDRIKHSNKFPLQSIGWCLKSRGISHNELDRISYYVDEPTANSLLDRTYLSMRNMQHRLDARALLAITLEGGLGSKVDRSKFRFYEHRLTHAASAIYHSGFDESLVYVIDNTGGIYNARRCDDGRVLFKTLARTPPSASLQRLCHCVLPFIGLGPFEEYKALALAAFGDPTRYGDFVDKLYRLLPRGEYELRLDYAMDIMSVIQPRRAGADPSQEHKDLAAALQRGLETVVLHVLRYFREKTGQTSLCLAGGMSENTGTNGRILEERLFERVFVPPAAYDSGCAVGAALLASEDVGKPAPKVALRSVAWGPAIGNVDEIDRELKLWGRLLHISSCAAPSLRAAELISQGAIIGWMQGRSEFGSHATGNRNVFTDPGPYENRQRVHDALSRTETYRPFALLIREEDFEEWVAVPTSPGSLNFQSFAVTVLEEKRSRIRAAIQADGRARLQTVSRELNEPTWNILNSLVDLGRTPALLSASFNTAMEPAVESVTDAVTTLLSSDIDCLIAGNFVVTKGIENWCEWVALCVSLPPYACLVRTKGLNERTQHTSRDEIVSTYNPGVRTAISSEVFELLSDVDGETEIETLLHRASIDTAGQHRLLAELRKLWFTRMIVIRPTKSRRKIHEEPKSIKTPK